MNNCKPNFSQPCMLFLKKSNSNRCLLSSGTGGSARWFSDHPTPPPPQEVRLGSLSCLSLPQSALRWALQNRHPSENCFIRVQMLLQVGSLCRSPRPPCCHSPGSGSQKFQQCAIHTRATGYERPLVSTCDGLRWKYKVHISFRRPHTRKRERM